jgi:peptidoglycan/LPS O-acetylase OafA/YrhL
MIRERRPKMLREDENAGLHSPRVGRRRSPYHTQVAGVLAAAFALSLAYSAIVTVTGSHEGYGLGDPILWAFYAVGFGLAALALADRMWAWWVVAVAVLALIAVGIFYYPTVFPPSAQTAFAWFENDVYVGLLILAEYLCVQRLRGVEITAVD